MRTTLCALGVLVLGGCAEVPQADDLAWEDGGEPVGVLAYETVPDASAAEPAPPPTPVEVAAPADEGQRPRLVVSAMRRMDPDRYDDDGAALCPFDVVATGFPAINTDGTKLAYWIAEHLSSSDGEDALGTFRIVDVATDQALEDVVVFDGNDGSGGGAYDDEGRISARHCRALHVTAKTNAATVNAMLADDGWRTMQPLALVMRDRAMFNDVPQWDDGSGDGEPMPPANERPVELVHMGKTAAFRIPGVKVLARLDADWDGAWESYCGGYTASLDEAFVDRDSSVIAVQVGQQSGPCFCYSETLVHAIPVTPEILATIDARPWPRDDA